MSPSPTADLRGILRNGLSKSLASLIIKIATAGLTYAMYVVMSRTMEADEYGQFAFGLSLATILAIGASMGQQTAILRFWPEDMVAGRGDKALQALRAGATLTIFAGIGISLALAVFAFGVSIVGPAGTPVLHLYGAVALILPMAAAEYFSSALRAQGSVWTALVPRDVIWRVAVPLAVVVLFFAGLKLSGWAALVLTAVLLVLALGLQFAFSGVRSYKIAPQLGGTRDYWRERGKMSRWFLFGTVIDSIALNADIILVGLFVSAASAGVYFNAFRTAGLMTLFTFAMTLVIAPMVAQHFHAGELRKSQAVAALCAWAGFLFSLVVFAAFFFFGHEILSLFGETYANGQLVLVLLSFGLLFDAATGPSRVVMMMTGHERAYVAIFGSIMIAGLLLQIAVIPFYGLVGAAVVNMVARIVAQTAIAVWSRMRIGIDTSLLGAFQIRRMADGPRVMKPAE